MRFYLAGAALIVASLTGQASAQEVILNPGKCAQYYPNANCQNYGPGNPYRSSYGASRWNYSYNRMEHRAHRRHYR
jgi:hypothetical protein